MKDFKKAPLNVLLICVVAVTLLCGIYAAPAFASHDEDVSSDASVAVQQKAVADEPDGQQDDTSTPDDAASSEDEVAADENQEADASMPNTDVDEPSGLFGFVAKVPGVFRDEMVKLFANATDTRQVTTTPEPQSNWKWPQKAYDRIQFTIDKTWKDENGETTEFPRTPEGEIIGEVFFRIEGFVDWNDDGMLEEWEKDASRNYRGINTGHLEDKHFGNDVFNNQKLYYGKYKPYYRHDSEGMIADDLNNDGEARSYMNMWYDMDSYFDRPDPETGEMGSIYDGYDCSQYNKVIAPYQIYYIVPHSSYAYNSEAGEYRPYDWTEATSRQISSVYEQEFYEFQLITTEVTDVIENPDLESADGPIAYTNERKTISFVFDENGNAKKHKIIYTVAELPIDGYRSLVDRVIADDEITWDERVVHNEVILATNIPGSLDKTGQLVIEKSFDGPIYANGYTGADGSVAYNEENASMAVFHIVGNLAEDGTGETVFDAYRSLSFYADGTSSQSIVIDNLPVGVWYTVTEVAFDGSGYLATDGNVRKFQLLAEVKSGEGADNAADVPAVTSTYTVSFSNRGTVTESPNQGWVNRYAPDGENIYTIKQIKRTEQLS